MARRDHAETLGKLVEVRALQRKAAEMKLAAETASLVDLERRNDAARDVLERQHRSWSEQVSGEAFSLPLAAAWSKAISTSQTFCVQLEAEIRITEIQKHQRTDDLRAAIARTDAAENLRTAAAKRQAHLRDDQALAALADRVAQANAVSR